MGAQAADEGLHVILRICEGIFHLVGIKGYVHHLGREGNTFHVTQGIYGLLRVGGYGDAHVLILDGDAVQFADGIEGGFGARLHIIGDGLELLRLQLLHLCICLVVLLIGGGVGLVVVGIEGSGHLVLSIRQTLLRIGQFSGRFHRLFLLLDELIHRAAELHHLVGHGLLLLFQPWHFIHLSGIAHRLPQSLLCGQFLLLGIGGGYGTGLHLECSLL